MRDLSQDFQSIRSRSEEICSKLAIEDHVIQTLEDVSPPKWHLGHTTWFFEQLVLLQQFPNLKPYNNDFLYLFNSYYETFGQRSIRTHRGCYSRPTVAEIMAYRACIDEQMLALLEQDEHLGELGYVIEVGLHHEQQHQELLCMDIKHILSENVGNVAYHIDPPRSEQIHGKPKWVGFSGGLVDIGFNADSALFAYDNELPRHQHYLREFSLRSHCVSNGDFLEFIEDGGYRDFRHWLSDGWHELQRQKWQAPLYWRKQDGQWFEYGFHGWLPLNLTQSVMHVSYFEAQAFAQWSKARIATEAEWEHACSATIPSQVSGAFFEDTFKPTSLASPSRPPVTKIDATTASSNAEDATELNSMLGGVWEWTQSAYLAYPGFKQNNGALNEYNAKFMSGQMVLRGGCLASPKSHVRPTYRNFYYPHQRWQFSGIRLAQD